MTRAVTDILYRTDGAPWASAPVTFERKAGSFDDGSSWPPDEKQVTTDATGAYSVQLWPDASGSLHSHYRVSYPNGDTFYVSIPDGTTPISMPEIRIAPLVQPVPPSALDAHVAASDPHAGYLLPAEADLLYAALVHSQPWSTITATPTTLAGYGITDAYTKTQADARYAPIVHSQAWSTISGTPTTLGGYGITDAYTKGEVDAALGGKANAATTLAGYGITDAYTKTQTDARYAPIAHNQAWSTITATPTTLGGYGITDAFTQAAADLRYAPLAHNQAWSTITGTPSTVAGYGITDVYTQTQSNANLALKANLAGGNALSGAQVITSTAVGQVPLTVKGFTGQTANLIETRDAANAALFTVTKAGNVDIVSGGSSLLIGADNNANTRTDGTLKIGRILFPHTTNAQNPHMMLMGNSAALHVGGGTASGNAVTSLIFYTGSDATQGAGTARMTINSGGNVLISGFTAPTAGLSVRGAASQAADLQQWQDSGGAILARTNKAGYRVINRTAAPADADLAAGELTQWFDQTAGAAKVMFKGKNAAGTVVTGQVALT